MLFLTCPQFRQVMVNHGYPTSYRIFRQLLNQFCIGMIRLGANHTFMLHVQVFIDHF